MDDNIWPDRGQQKVLAKDQLRLPLQPCRLGREYFRPKG